MKGYITEKLQEPYAKYPIYHLGISYTIVMKDNTQTNDSTGKYIMFENEKSDSELKSILEKWKEDIIKRNLKKPEFNNLDNINEIIKFIEYNDWCPDWFTHYTFDKNQTDEEAYNSFMDYRERSRQEFPFYELDFGTMFVNQGNHPYSAHYLMGGEDSWRIGHHDEEKELIPYMPCRCNNCKSNKILTFDH